MSNLITTVKIGGQAGQGIKSVGLMFAKLAIRSGYNTYDYTEYPSLIRGGHNVMQINFSLDDVTAPRKTTDLLIALNQDTVNKHVHELVKGSGLIYDQNDKVDTAKLPKDVDAFPIPLSTLAAESGGKDLLINIVALGALVALYDGDLSILKELILEEFGSKGDAVVLQNNKAADAGYNYALDNYKTKVKFLLKPIESLSTFIPKIVINGTDAAALGAIRAGIQFAAMYPMSPISNILTTLALHQEKYKYVFKQAEDEIAAINMSIGASVAGARAMTATSGGGFALMAEGYGLAGMVEAPLVIVEGMRGAPATGLPTWSEQGDLRFVLHAHQGDFPHIVLAPGDPKEVFEMTMQAFNLADKYQLPVVILIDKNICENDQSYLSFDTSSYKIERGKFTTEVTPDFKRYADSSDGVSTRSIMGAGNFFIANSDEHDEYGYSTEEIEARNIMMSKRMRKMETCIKEDMASPVVYGSKNADITLVSWGSNKGSILQALKTLPKVNYVHITWMNPFPAEQVKELLGKAKHIIDIECNYSGQLAGLIREKTGIEITDKMLRSDGRPFYPEDIEEKVKLLRKKK